MPHKRILVTSMEKYKLNQFVNATIEQVFPFGVFARLNDGTRAYIRRRELSLDTDIEPCQTVHEGEIIEAVILSLNERNNPIELSHRAVLIDPWPQFLRDYHVGQSIRGTVHALKPRGAYISILSGIEGFIPRKELTTMLERTPEDVLWVDDDIEAVITRIEPQSRHINLSIKARISKCDQAMESSKTKLVELKNKEHKIASHKENNTPEKEIGLYQRVGPILIVEDDDSVRASLSAWLSRKGYQVSTAANETEVFELQLTSYRVCIVDLVLSDGDGLDLIRKIRKTNNKASICITSSPEMLAERVNEIEAAQVTDVLPKPLDLDDVERFLARVLNSNHLPVWKTNQHPSDIQIKSNASQYSEIRPFDHLQNALSEISNIIQARTSLLFRLNPDSQTISILAQSGDGEFFSSESYELGMSPVKDVIQEGASIFENRVTENALVRFNKLLFLFPFESCIGIPIRVRGEINCAAFFFHPEVDAFSRYHLRDAHAGAFLLSAILTEMDIQERLLSLNPMLLSGELAAGFEHDVFNKITALELEIRNLQDIVKTRRGESLGKVLELVLDLKDTAKAFQQIIRTDGQMEVVDISQVIEHAKFLLQELARKKHTEIILKLTPDLPIMKGSSIFLQQAFINIMLNAIQQMEIKALKYEWSGQRTLEITSSKADDFLQIRFRDNGPGIHKRQIDKIFTPGFSTRGGSGLGLYIARSFIQTLGGVLTVEEACILKGTTFLVMLPLAKVGEQT